MIEKPRLHRRASTRLSRQWSCESRDAFATGDTAQAAYLNWAKRVADKREAVIALADLREQFVRNQKRVSRQNLFQTPTFEWACR